MRSGRARSRLVILRPGLVLAPAVYGGTAMLRGLAGVPLLSPVDRRASARQVVSVDDLAETVALCLGPARAGGRRGTWRIRRRSRWATIVAALQADGSALRRGPI